jgi:hypothetical protein
MARPFGVKHNFCSISIAHPPPPSLLLPHRPWYYHCLQFQQGGHNCPRHLENSPGQPHQEEWIKIIIVPPALWCGARVRGTKTLKTLHFKSFSVDQLRVVSRYFLLIKPMLNRNQSF